MKTKKQNLVSRTLGLLFILMLAVSYSCNRSGDERKESKIIPIVDIPKDVSNFLEKGLPNTSESECFFISQDDDIFYLINNIEDFRDVYSCDDELPEIDFTKYSLIIGKKEMPNSFYLLADQYIEETEMLNLTIVATLPKSGHWPAFNDFYYWGIYPKLPNKELIVNINIKE
ncbi:MAG: hypothetical protein Q4G16_05230 [Cruoricaptor ignavus]|nr:hypothetical protein [Cruoricaptor ignavus]